MRLSMVTTPARMSDRDGICIPFLVLGWTALEIASEEKDLFVYFKGTGGVNKIRQISYGYDSY